MKADKLVFDAKNPYSIKLDEIDIKNIKTDSREVETGDLFVAIKGHTVDSHQYIEQVVEQGTSLIVANVEMIDKVNPETLGSAGIVFVENTYDYLSTLMNRFLDYPSHKLNLFGITGTNGKTSTASILTQILSEAGQKSGVIGTIGARTAGHTYPLENTTPDPHTLQTLFSHMVDDGIESTVMEVSSIGLVEKRTKETDFSVAIFTNLSQDHLDFHGTMENYRDAKAIFFRELEKTNSRGQENFVVMNVDDEIADYYIKQAKATVVTYGIKNPADYQATNIHYTDSGTHFTLNYKDETYEIQTPLIGEFNVYNVLAALVAAHVKGISLEQIIPILKRIDVVPGRLETVSNADQDDILVIVDFAHTPDSLEKALQTIRQIEHNKVISVFGCGGDRDATKRPIMAQIGVDNSDLAIFTADNPRTEDQSKIFEDMKAGLNGTNYQQIDDRRAAIQYAVEHAEKGDIILIAGKGHEDYQIIGKEKHHFDDREEARAALEQRRK